MNATEIALCDLNEVERAVVTGLRLESSISRRLRDLGLIEGTAVFCCRIAPGGSPAAYRFRGAVIALRAIDAAGIDVRRLQS